MAAMKYSESWKRNKAKSRRDNPDAPQSKAEKAANKAAKKARRADRLRAERLAAQNSMFIAMGGFIAARYVHDEDINKLISFNLPV